MRNRHQSSYLSAKEPNGSGMGGSWDSENELKIVCLADYKSQKAADKQTDFQARIIKKAAEAATKRGW